MFSPGEIAQTKAEIERLEILHKECRDRFLRTRIEAWIEAEKKKLVSDENSQQPTTLIPPQKPIQE